MVQLEGYLMAAASRGVETLTKSVYSTTTCDPIIRKPRSTISRIVGPVNMIPSIGRYQFDNV